LQLAITAWIYGLANYLVSMKPAAPTSGLSKCMNAIARLKHVEDRNTVIVARSLSARTREILVLIAKVKSHGNPSKYSLLHLQKYTQL
jgi:hypothetical protein